MVPPVPVAAVSTSTVTTSPLYVTPAEQRDLKERSKQMFYHAYDSYMHNAFPEVSESAVIVRDVHRALLN